MSAAVRCPHCKAELPEKAAFCANCGRRIEGWSLSKNATPASGEPALPGSDEATRQMQPTPSLLRAAAVSVKKGGKGNKRKGGASKLPLALGMLVVAVAGGVGGFFFVRARVRRSPSIVVRKEPAPAPVVTPPPSVTPNPQLPTPNPPAPKTLVRKSKTGKKAHVIASAPVAVKARATVAGGLPHKQVATDSKPMTMPTAAHETTSVASSAPPQTEAEQKQEAEAGVDGESVRLVVRQHLPQVRACYGRAFKDASPGGTVEIGFAIDPAGRAKNVRTETNTTDSEPLAHCLEQRVREWQFPRPVGGDYELIYPFVFAPGS